MLLFKFLFDFEHFLAYSGSKEFEGKDFLGLVCL